MYSVAWFYFPRSKRCPRRRHLATFFTSTCKNSSSRSNSAITQKVVVSALEHDSHANTVVLGRNAIIMGYTGRECEVLPYTKQYEAIKGVPIVKGATGYTDATTSERWILIFKKALFMGDQLEHLLFNPNQLRHFGCEIQDNPYSYSIMSITSPDGDVVIPLTSEGTTI